MPRPAWILLALAVACDARPGPTPPPTPTPTREPAPVAATPTPAEQAPARDPAAELPPAPEFAAGPFEVRVGKGKLKPPSKAFVFRPNGDSMMDHVWASGWTEDGAAFAYCKLPAGASCEECVYVSPVDGKQERVQAGEECDEGVTRLSAKALRARLAERKVAVRDGTWAHGGELLVTARGTLGAKDVYGEARGVLKVGTARRDGAAAGEVHAASECWKVEDGTFCLADAHADMILPSPDGATVAILGHMWAGEWSDAFQLAFVPAGRLAAATYNKQGLDALARQDFTAAATAFLAAMHADTAAWKGPYNLGCAYARAGDPRAQAALQAAVQRDGAAVRKRAATDRDLDGVRAQAWFTALMRPAR